MVRRSSFGLRHGVSEDLICLGPSNIPILEGKGIGCYAAKVNTHWMGIPFRKYVDSYVVASGDGYYTIKENGVSLLQKEGLLPTPAPAHRLSAIEMGWGHSLGIIAGFFLLAILAYKILPQGLRKQVDAVVKAPVISESELAHVLSGSHSEMAQDAACLPNRVIIVDHSHISTIRSADIADLPDELSLPGFPEEELNDEIIEDIKSKKRESFRLTNAHNASPSASYYVNTVIFVNAGQRPLVKIIRSTNTPPVN